MKYPYLADVIGLEGYKDMSDKDLALMGVSGMAEEIESYILKTIEAREWEPTLENFKDIVKEMMKEASIDDRIQPTVKLDKLYQTMKYLKEMSKFNKMKKEVEGLSVQI